jgi:hypothetical protein
VVLDRRCFGTGGYEIDGFDYDYGAGKWYSFRLVRSTFGLMLVTCSQMLRVKNKAT